MTRHAVPAPRVHLSEPDVSVPVRSLALDAKLSVGASDDLYEREADRIADQVVGTEASTELAAAITPRGATVSRPLDDRRLQRQAEPEEENEEEEEEETLQRQEEKEEEEEEAQAKVVGGGLRAAALDATFETAVARERSGGTLMDAATRQYFEPRFGVDFGEVRLHDGSAASALAKQVGARGFTLGHDIFFGPGEFDTRSTEGRRLLAHELTHTVQQGAVRAPHPETARAAGAPGPRVSHGPAMTVQRVRPRAPVEPTRLTFSFTEPVHTPPCSRAALRARTDGNPVTWSLEAGTAAVHANTTISRAGVITIAPAQVAGTIRVKAAGATRFVFRDLQVRSHPIGITSSRIEAAAPATDYGAVFEHVFTSNDGNVASLENVGVGEKFPGIPNPNGASHRITAPTWPFGGTFTLSTATLTNNASNNWFLTAAGELGGTHDNVLTQKAGINVGHFVQSASRPRPAQGLPADMTIDQHLNWFCPQKPAARRWTDFVTLAHSRTLRNRGGVIEFVTTVNGVQQIDNYEGPTAVSNLTASPVNTPRSAAAPAGGGPAPAARTVSLTVDTLPAALPAGQTLTWSIVGANRGCSVAANAANPKAATLTIGRTAGTVTIQVADSTGTNRARVRVRIT